MTHEVAPAFFCTSGPRDAKIAVVGEAFGETEALTGLPLMGASGQEFNRMLKEAGLNRSDIFCTNVFAFRPQSNNIESLCISRAELTQLQTQGEKYAATPLLQKAFRQGKYFHPQYYDEVLRLQEELSTVRPNLLICLGNTACWALLGSTRIGSIRGAITNIDGGKLSGIKVLPTYHPAAILRNWAQRPIVIADLIKAAREQHFPEIRRPERYLLVNPTLDEILEWFRRPASAYSIDIETFRKQIEMISFARNPKDAIVIPFISKTSPDYSHWPDPLDELRAWNIIGAALESNIPKIFQNGIFDISYLARMGLRINNAADDTMLLHHSLYPEMRKGLGFLGSIYTGESSWKLMRLKGVEELKRDE